MENTNKILDSRTIPLEAGQYYHIFNKGNSKENIFLNDENYKFFLRLYIKYLQEFFEIIAYCLLPNHFHFHVKVKELDDLQSFEYFVSLNSSNIEEQSDKINHLIGERLRLFFMSYAKAFNKRENRQGSLFKKIYRRKRIDNHEYLLKLIVYIHLNPIHHGFTNSFEDYIYSSYKGFVTEKSTYLNRSEVLEWFGGKNAFIESHIASLSLKNEKKFWETIEE